ncbi:ABC transporter ATP-binding protein [Aurantivibrio infirmus]
MPDVTNELSPSSSPSDHGILDSMIAIRGLSYQYKNNATKALESIDLEIGKGRCFGLLGPNGAGKTTLLSILTGILPPQGGDVVIAGTVLNHGKQIKKISAIVPQDFAFYPSLSGQDNLNFFAGLIGLKGDVKKQRIVNAVAICSLENVLHKNADTYSGGLKRRLNLAIGLLGEPEILYLDEPTVGIDAQSRKFILDAIKDLKSNGMTIIYTSHYMEEIQAICDDIAIIDQGRVVAQNSLAGMLGDFNETLVSVQLAQYPDQQSLASLNSLGKYKLEGLTLRIDLSSTDTSIKNLLDTLKQTDLSIRQIQYGLSPLEDIYLSITKPELRE